MACQAYVAMGVGAGSRVRGFTEEFRVNVLERFRKKT
jgi:hypothetical protein